MTIFKPKTASEEFNAIVSKELSLVKEKHAITERLAATETAAAEAYLLGTGGEAEVDQIGKLQNQAAAIDRAITLVRKRRPEIIAAEARAEAARLRSESAQKGKELTILMQRTQRLLDQLGELQGVPFTADILMREVANSFELHNPRFRQIEADILALDTKAMELETQFSLPEAGNVDLESVTSAAEVVKAVLDFRGISPDSSQVMQWCQAVEAAARADRAVTLGDRPRRVRLEWDKTGIKPDSYTYVASLALPRPSSFHPTDHIMPSGGIDIESAMFRAPRKLSAEQQKEWSR